MIDNERRTYLEQLQSIHRNRVEVAEQLAREGKLPEKNMSQFVAGIKDRYSTELKSRAGTRRGGRPKLYDDSHFKEVATVYTAACRCGNYPTQAVKNKFHLSESQARKWVAECRKMGLLPSTTRGQVSVWPDTRYPQEGR
jgi:hypothetical protein